MEHYSELESSPFYKSSNKVPLMGAIISFLCISLFGSLLSIPYLWGNIKSPLVILNIILLILFIMAIGIFSHTIMKFFKIRNLLVASIIAALSTIVITFFKWCFWTSYMWGMFSGALNPSFIKYFKDFALSPKLLIAVIKEINAIGTWSIDKSLAQGIILWLVWLAELLIIFIGIIFVTKEGLDIPFIESDNHWAIKDKDHMIWFAGADLSLAQIKEAQINPSALLSCSPQSLVVGYPKYSLVVFHSEDHQENYISITQHTLGHKNKEQIKVICKYLRVNHSLIAELQEQARKSIPTQTA